MVLSIGILFIAFFYSKFLLSISQILICTTALWNYLETKEGSSKREKTLYLWILLFFFLPFISGLYSSDLEYWLLRMKIKLPYLILPLAFIFLPILSRKEIERLYFFFLITGFSSVLYYLILYLFNANIILEQIRVGGHFPTIVNHIRYSLTLAIAVVISIHLFLEGTFRVSQYLILAIGLACFVFMHLLAVRSGLIAMYLGVLTIIIHRVIINRQFRLLFFLPGLVLLILLAYLFIPSFALKIGYSYWEFMELLGQSDAQTTLNSRVKSYNSALEVIRNHPVFGVGAGDLKEEMAKIWVMNYGYGKSYLPHNQFLTWLSSLGFVFTSVLTLAYISPLWSSLVRSSAVSWAILGVIGFSFLVENTIENSYGVAIHSFFALWLIYVFSPSSHKESDQLK